MNRLRNIALFLLLATAIIVGLGAAPVAFFLLWSAYPLTWPEELQHFQALAAGLVALLAASLGLSGVLLTIRSQRLNVQRQLEAQRKEQVRARSLAREQVAGAFIGEISVQLEELRHELVRPVLLRTLHALEQEDGLVSVTTVRIGGKFSRYFESNPGNVGLFPTPIPANLTRFYSRFEAIKLDLDRYSDIAENLRRSIRAAQSSLPADLTDTHLVIYLLQTVLENIAFCLAAGPALIQELDAVRSTPNDSAR